MGQTVSSFVKNIWRVNDTLSALDALDFMKKKGISSVLICDQDNVPCGVFSLSTFVNKLSGNVFKTIGDVDVGLAVDTEMVFIQGDASAEDALKVMQENNCNYLIVKQNVSILGLVSAEDLFLLSAPEECHNSEEVSHDLADALNVFEASDCDSENSAGIFKNIAIERDNALKTFRKSQKTLIQKESAVAMGEIASEFAHEIKNPLGIILQGIERLEKFVTEHNDEKCIRHAVALKASAHRLNSMAVSLRSYYRAANESISSVNIFDIIEESITLVAEDCKNKGVTIKRDYERQDKPMAGDAVMLGRMFLNLFTNAINAMPEGGELKITVAFKQYDDKKDCDGDFVIEVTDTGVGMDEETVENIFKPFFTTQDAWQEGAGFGLNIVNVILERHNGSIAVESEKNVGTKIIITFPIGGAEEIIRRLENVR